MDRRAFLNGPRADYDAAPAAIGSSPPNFDPYVQVYTDVAILEMMVFYNENFGIVPADGRGDRVSKFCHFFSDF